MPYDVKEIARQLAELNQPVPEAEAGPLAVLTIELPTKVVARLQAVADREDTSFEKVVVMCLRDGLVREEASYGPDENGRWPEDEIDGF